MDDGVVGSDMDDGNQDNEMGGVDMNDVDGADGGDNDAMGDMDD